MTEETPFNPCSRKGETRAGIAAALIDEWKAGTLTGMIARAADFYGPDTANSAANLSCPRTPLTRQEGLVAGE